ncbi:unnamed protein product, partial [Rotaria magnacalcarata]
PYSIAIGDFNDDTFLDIAVANHGINKIGILIGNGYGNFVSQFNYSTDPACPYSIGSGGFNQDDRLDIAITNDGTNNIALSSWLWE